MTYTTIRRKFTKTQQHNKKTRAQTNTNKPTQTNTNKPTQTNTNKPIDI